MFFAWAYIEDPWKEFDEDHLPYLSHQCARSMAVRLNSAYQGRAETTHFFRHRFELFWVLSILKHPAIVVSTVCPYPVVIQFCSCHAAFTEEDVGLCETLVPPNLMLYHRFTLFKYAVHIGVNPSLPDTPCRNLLNMVIDNGYLSHTVMSHSIQIMFRLAQCLSHFQTQTQQTVVPSWRCRRRRRNRIAAKNIVTWRNTTGVEFY